MLNTMSATPLNTCNAVSRNFEHSKSSPLHCIQAPTQVWQWHRINRYQITMELYKCPTVMIVKYMYGMVSITSKWHCNFDTRIILFNVSHVKQVHIKQVRMTYWEYQYNICDTIKGNESLVENFYFYFLSQLSETFKMPHFDANPITIWYLVTEL